MRGRLLTAKPRMNFLQVAFKEVGLDWRRYVKEETGIMTRKRRALVGSPKKLIAMTGWRPTIDFSGMVRALVRAESEGK